MSTVIPHSFLLVARCFFRVKARRKATRCLAVLPLIKRIADQNKPIWYADDATGGGRLRHVRTGWDTPNRFGPSFGYFPNTAKTWLLVKEPELAEAHELFADTGVKITTEGRRLFGAPIGTDDFCKEFLQDQVSSWLRQLICLGT